MAVKYREPLARNVNGKITAIAYSKALRTFKTMLN